MVAPLRTKKFFCTVVRVPVADEYSMRINTARIEIQQPATRPSDLLPWADPYIARLVTKLQDEVRDQRTQSRVISRIAGTCLADLEPPCPETNSESDWQDEPRWSDYNH